MAVITSAVVVAGGAAYAANRQSSAGTKAARAGTKAADQANVEQRRQFDQARSDQMPWLEAGRAALGRLSDPAAFTASPDYAFRRSEGLRDTQNMFAFRGGAQSGNAQRALIDYNSNLASGEYGNWFNRQAGIAGVGQSTAQSVGAFGANAANQIGNNFQAAGDARASGVINSANAWGDAANSFASIYGDYTRRKKPTGIAAPNTLSGPR